MPQKRNHYANEKECPFIELKLNDQQREEFQKVLKKGIYKELYRKKMLTEEQLGYLLNRV